MKRKESHWEHEEEVILDKGKTGKKLKCINKVSKSSECSILLRHTIEMMITIDFVRNPMIKST